MTDNFDNFQKQQLVEKQIPHPCETVFDIEDGSTTIVSAPPRTTNLVQPDHYDTKDQEIEEQFQEIYDKSMDTFDDMQRDMEGIEGKYKARNGEVSVAFLNTALNAAKEKARVKEHKDKLSPLPNDGKVVNNTQINVSTSDIIKMLADRRDPANNYVPDEEDLVTPQRTTIKRKKKDDPS